ncbi:sugar-binding domain-containing protein [Agriterribacter sp.]|uniref:glycoside hydrolase family 2 protein n=1 Tax=Agriterribacter sp. TaxID=2821509 RepID=UPI002CE770FF|nr:sugar-binding domain-containing protein [Agriterribacter sp.]HRP58239.1 glycoside hydrolase family 2 TIM barrel-domain containing protein [Agriterribacter sp.]
MKPFLSIVFGVVLSMGSYAQEAWKPVEGKITTPWSANVKAEQPLPEYPRPQLTRKSWMNLNGLWQYAIVPKASGEGKPAAFDGSILVPYAVESALSGVGKTVGQDGMLWYERTIEVPSAYKKGKVLLHFGAVDWQCDVYVNGTKVGSHQGGYDPFSFDMSAALKKGKQQEIAVRVWDPSDDGPQPRGKQIKNPHGIWYTPVTGIWQTVWLENVPSTYIASTVQTPDIDKQSLSVKVDVENLQPGDVVKVIAYDGQQQVAEQTLKGEEEATLTINNPKLWSPGDPFIYDLKYTVTRKGKLIDEAGSYFAMRKISEATDNNGVKRMLLNNEFVFQYGPLDQGWWPDGLYTAPTDEALKYDVEQTKAMGFNMIRKHVKVEPARWYYHCDKLGMLVWQDMPSGDMGGNKWDMRVGQISGKNHDKERSAESEAIYRTEWKAIMNALHNFPSIVVWVPFNEAWGQFKTKEITEWTMQLDPSRLVNEASGGNFFTAGHILDIHNYPDPQMPSPEIFGDKQILVLGEFGGLGLPVAGHTWQDKNNWGYQSFKNSDELLDRYTRLINDLTPLIPLGLSAAVYTQTTDVEVEVNGLMTYDRKIMKMPLEKLKQLHQQLYDKGLVKMK